MISLNPTFNPRPYLLCGEYSLIKRIKCVKCIEKLRPPCYGRFTMENNIYIHQLLNWPHFSWQVDELATALANARYSQGRLTGRIEVLGIALRTEASLDTLTEEVVTSSSIEGENLNRDQVRSSLARRLGIDLGGLPPADRYVEGVVEMMIDATQRYEFPLTSERLFGWQAALFPAGRSGMTRINVGKWRDDSAGPMEVVSGPIGKEKVHFQAPQAALISHEMQGFLEWFNGNENVDPLLKAGIAHLWFVTIHPFDDGNGRIARAIADLQLARSEGISQRFYSMSSQILLKRKVYYDILERTQKDTLDITDWLRWFLGCLSDACEGAESTLEVVLRKARFFEQQAGARLNDRQRIIIGRLLDGFEGKLTSRKWATLCGCSQDTALRDITDLIEQHILAKDSAGSRSTSYSLVI